MHTTQEAHVGMNIVDLLLSRLFLHCPELWAPSLSNNSLPLTSSHLSRLPPRLLPLCLLSCLPWLSVCESVAGSCSQVHRGKFFTKGSSSSNVRAAFGALSFLPCSGSSLRPSAFRLGAACVSGCSCDPAVAIPKCWFHASHFPWLEAPS